MSPQREIAEHHEVIEGWLRGTADPSALRTFVAAHDPDFTLCGPDGTVAGLPEVAAMVERAYGAEPGLEIRIRDVRVVAESGGLVVALYEEHQRTPAGSTARRSTVVFGTDPAARNGLRWRHLHETWA